MIRRFSVVLIFALANFACSKDPVLGANVDLSDVGATSSAPSASASRSPVLSRPPLTRHAVAGFPPCVVDAPWPSFVCKGGGGMCSPNMRMRTVGDLEYAVTELRPLLAGCLQPSLLPSSIVWATIGIQPSGRICAPSFMSSEVLLPQCLACAARRLHMYRAPVADRSSERTFSVVIPVGAPVVLRATPPQ
jgi:hypothetical protein